MEAKTIKDRYNLITMIGSGGNAKVFLAYDTIGNREVAIKILDIEIDDENSYDYKRFKQESLILASFDHKNIAKVYDFGIEDKKPFVVMEYIKGSSLKQVIHEQRYLRIDEVKYYMEIILDTIGYSHSLGIVHRDLKPDNMIVSEDGRLVIIDFGTAFIRKKEYNIYKDEQKIGMTVQYLAPEFSKSNTGNIQTDLYAIGISFYEMIAGVVPYNSDKCDNNAIISMHRTEPLPDIKQFNPTCPDSFIRVIKKACAKSPINRYKNAFEFKQDLLLAYDEYKNPEKYQKKGFFARLFRK